MNDKVFKIFTDFDGTVSVTDVGESIVNRFGDKEEIKEILKLWMSNQISSPESWYRMLATFKGFNIDTFNEFLTGMRICPTFRPFVNYCDENGFDIKILSDGFDVYIKPLLEREGLENVKFFSNQGIISGDKIKPVFPYGDEECKFCGNCKRNHVLTNSGDTEYTVYIGDGYSDKCPVEYCDFIFAKKTLLKYCEKNRITYFPFQDFSDVMKKLEELKGKKHLKKRYQAELKRREIFKLG